MWWSSGNSYGLVIGSYAPWVVALALVWGCSNDLSHIEEAIESGNHLLAETLIDEAIDDGITDPQIYLLKAKINMDNLQWKQAIENINMCMILDEDNHDGLVLKGQILNAIDTEEALRFFEDLEGTRHYTDPEIISTHGLTLLDADRLEDALQVFVQAHELTPSAKSAFNLGYIYDMLGKPRKGEDYYLESLSYDPGYNLALYNLGEMKFENGLYNEATLYFTQLTDTNPEDYEAWYCLGMTYIETGNPAAACDCFYKAEQGGYQYAISAQSKYCIDEA